MYRFYRLWIEWDSFYAIRCDFLANGDSEMVLGHRNRNDDKNRIPISEQVRQFRHSCMVQSIPHHLRGDRELFDFFNQLFPDKVRRIELVLTCPLLRELISKRQNYIEAYEKVFGKWLVFFCLNYRKITLKFKRITNSFLPRY